MDTEAKNNAEGASFHYVPSDELTSGDTCNEKNSFITFCAELCGILAFFFIGTLMFWFTITAHFIEIIKRISQAGRQIQMMILVFILIVVLSMILTSQIQKSRTQKLGVMSKNSGFCGGKKNTTTINSGKSKCLHNDCMKVTIKDKSFDQQNKNATERKVKEFTLSIRDEKRKELYRYTKKFSIPAEWAREMKSPPALILYIKSILIENY